MAFVLKTELGDRQLRLPLAAGTFTIGSDPGADFCLPHPSVSRRHALLHVSAEGVEIEDTDSQNGIFVGGRRVLGRRALVVGTLLKLGAVRALLTEVEDADLQTAVALPAPVRPVSPAASTPRATTVSDQVLEHFLLDRLPALLRLAGEGAGALRVAQEAGDLLSRALPCHGLSIWRQQGRERALLFRFERSAELASGSALSIYEAGAFALEIHFAAASYAVFYGPLAQASIELVRLASPRSAPTVRPRGSSTANQEAADPPPSLSPSMVELYHQAQKVAPGRIGVLILGESGTGKEIFARFLHAASGLSTWVALNCAALPRDLLEAELFGIERGVATGVDARPGKFELADGGTLFLDEIGDMSLETQARILRVLELGQVHRLGGREARPARARVLAATNCDLPALVEAGRFRRDLYHRIADWTVTLPPLSERRADIPQLAARFLERESERLGRPFLGISEAAVQALAAFSWPGNIRQLEREIARAALFLGPGELLDTSRLAPEIQRARKAPSASSSLEEKLADTERREIEHALAAAQGDTTKAAAELGIGRSTLYRRMAVLGVGTG